MTTDAIAPPNLDNPVGQYGASRVTHVKNLLARAAIAGSLDHLNPTVIRRMRRHYQVASCLLVQSLPLVRADWSIECDDDRIRETLTAAYASVAFTVHRSMTRALAWGRSPNTVTWTHRDDLRGIYPSEIRDLDPGTCTPLLDDFGTLDGFMQQIGGSADDAFTPIESLWIVEGMESGNYWGRSILEAALDPWQDYAAIRAFHARYLERFGEPVVLCRAPAGTSIENLTEIEAATAQRQALSASGGDPNTVPVPAPRIVSNLDVAMEIGENIRHHTVVALPATLLYGGDGKPTGFAWELEYLESKTGGGTDFLEALRELDKRIARAMFVPDLLTQNDATTGSYALGQTHKSVWTESVEGRLDDYSRQITAQLLTPMRVLNFGAGSADARLVFSPLADEERDRLWALVTTLVEHGELPDLAVREIATAAGLPVLDETEVAAKVAAAAAAAASTPPPTVTNAGGRPVLELAATAGTTDGLPAWKVPQADAAGGTWARPLNNRETRVGFARIERAMNAAEAAALEILTALLDTEHDRVLRQINGILGKGSPAEILAGLGTVEIKGGPTVLRAWADLMAAVGDQVVTELRTELSTYTDLVRPVGPEGRALFKAYAATNADRALTAIMTEVRLELLNAWTSGVTGKPALLAIVAQVFAAHADSEAKPLRLTTRMLASKALNYTRAAAVMGGGIPLAGAQYSAVLDRVTCDLCAKLDESVIAIESTDLARFTPPIHHNCRCLWVWITREEADFTPTWVTPSNTDVARYGGLVVG